MFIILVLLAATANATSTISTQSHNPRRIVTKARNSKSHNRKGHGVLPPEGRPTRITVQTGPTDNSPTEGTTIPVQEGPTPSCTPWPEGKPIPVPVGGGSVMVDGRLLCFPPGYVSPALEGGGTMQPVPKPMLLLQDQELTKRNHQAELDEARKAKFRERESANEEIGAWQERHHKAEMQLERLRSQTGSDKWMLDERTRERDHWRQQSAAVEKQLDERKLERDNIQQQLDECREAGQDGSSALMILAVTVLLGLGIMIWFQGLQGMNYGKNTPAERETPTQQADETVEASIVHASAALEKQVGES